MDKRLECKHNVSCSQQQVTNPNGHFTACGYLLDRHLLKNGNCRVPDHFFLLQIACSWMPGATEALISCLLVNANEFMNSS